MTYPMSAADRELRQRARAFVDELLPFEVEAELHGGELPAELLEAQERRVRELGFGAVNMPKELGGGGFSAFQQVLVQEQWLLSVQHSTDDVARFLANFAAFAEAVGR